MPVSATKCSDWRCLELRQHDPLLCLVLAFAVGVAGLADFVAFEEQNLAQAFVGVDAGGERRCVRDFQGDKAFPLGLKRRDVDDEAAAGVGACTHAESQYAARKLEML